MNNYAAAIDLLEHMKPEEYRGVLVEIAKLSPSSLTKAHRASIASPRGPRGPFKDELWAEEAYRLVRTGNKIAAIRHIRQVAGMGLVEAKAAAESL